MYNGTIIRRTVKFYKKGIIFMEQFNSFGTNAIWVGIVAAVFFGTCLYFSLTYFEQLKKGDEQLIKQSKFLAVISLLLALTIPLIYQLYIFNQMMNYN